MTGPLQQLFKRMQSAVGELGDAVLGDKLERILDQDIRDTDRSLQQAREQHAACKAMRISMEDQASQTQQSIQALEAGIVQLLRKRGGPGARQQAARVVILTAERVELMGRIEKSTTDEHTLLLLVEQLEHQLRRFKHQLGTLRAAVSIQQAQEAVARRQPGPALHPEPALVSAELARKRKQATDGQASQVRAHKGTRAEADIDPVERVLQRLSAHAKSAKRAPPRKPR